MTSGAPSPRRPSVVVHADVAALQAAAADYIGALLRDSIAARGICHIALAGGRTPRAVYERLAADSGIDWSKVVVLFGDERAVPADDAASNYRMAREALLERVTPRAVHRIEGERPAADAAREYDKIVAACEPLDVVLLGMGDDGHVASFFPATPEPPSDARVVATISPLPPAERVSVTLPVIRRARAVLLLVTGAGKAERLAEVWQQIDDGRPILPAARAVNEFGTCRWHVDGDAAARLPEAAT